MKYKTKLEHSNIMKMDKHHCGQWLPGAKPVLQIDPDLVLNTSGDVIILDRLCPIGDGMMEIARILFQANVLVFLD